MRYGFLLALTGAICGGVLLTGSTAQAQSKAKKSPGSKGERLDVDALKEKYWSKGEETKVQVVQNRLYTKGGKVEIGPYFAFASVDPFLNVTAIGGHIGYHLNEYVALNVNYWKDSVSASSALSTFEAANGFTVNTNEPQSFLGAEIAISPVYGKLSVFGKAIVYYDLHVTAGAGQRKTESGSYIGPIVGIGQQIYLTRWLSLRADYRLLRYEERILEKVIPEDIGKDLGPRTNTTGIVTLGFDFLLF